MAWTSKASGKVRYAMLDLGLAAVTAGPFDLALAEDQVVLSAVHVAGAVVLLTEGSASSTMQIHRFDDATGAETAAPFAVTNPSPTPRGSLYRSRAPGRDRGQI